MRPELVKLFDGMTEGEARLLIALAKMSDQYITDDKGVLDHLCMSAGESAVELLVHYKLLDPGPRGGSWTELGWALLKSC